MNVTAGVPDQQDLPALQSLHEWLRRSPGLVVSAQSGPAHQGAAEIVNIVLSNTIALGSFLVSLRAWLGTRPAKPPITFEIGDVKVTLPDDSPESVAVLEKALRAALELHPSLDYQSAERDLHPSLDYQSAERDLHPSLDYQSAEPDDDGA
jgi:hypothetical protein